MPLPRRRLRPTPRPAPRPWRRCRRTPAGRWPPPSGAAAEVSGMPEAEPPGLGEQAEPMRALADLDRVEQLARAGVDDVDGPVVAPGEPQLAAVGAHAAHVGAAADLPGGGDGAGGGVDH